MLLQLKIARRNARLRAWRAHGVPIEGGWIVHPDETYVSLSCAACGGKTRSLGYDWPGLPNFLEAIENAEIERLGKEGCSHVYPLLSRDDPPEVNALVELELLAGD